MKSLIKTFFLAAVLSTSFIFISCEEFENLEINVPFSIELTRQGIHPDDYERDTVCLDTESSTFQEYMNDFESLTFVEAALRVKEVIPTNMTGDIYLWVVSSTGDTLISESVLNVRPADYMNTPYVLPLSAQEIQLINNYLALIQQNQVQPCFEGILQTQNIPGWDINKKIVFSIDIVIQGEVNL
ncbi:MAG: hypothetical protein JW866_08515 [Ignavibacteriales bacterium]|nr:hypothetical protein [Ignavibacteriales bacterium]